eukprot:TRINITY_DN6346_c0_g1_i1.p1 TRINITY_DN6346_c0_g1~~TRINITY_DN6346_c0_g1_i1.p1  ORF type:complete len:515 (-),score=99.42 TRINITY_DN6346_c0_g1_i1:4-1548(-)
MEVLSPQKQHAALYIYLEFCEICSSSLLLGLLSISASFDVRDFIKQCAVASFLAQQRSDSPPLAEELTLLGDIEEKLVELRDFRITTESSSSVDRLSESQIEVEELSNHYSPEVLAEDDETSEEDVSPSYEVSEDHTEAACVLVQAHIRGHAARVLYKRTKTRKYVVNELVNTEISYLDSINTMLNVWVFPLEQISTSQDAFVSPKEVETIFGSTRDVYKFNTVLLDRLKRRLADWNCESTVGDIFVTGMLLLNPHVQYLLNYTQALLTLNKCMQSQRFALFIENTLLRPELKHQDLRDFLILPVQRLPRYTMLIENLNKLTDSDHPDKTNLSQAVFRLKQLTDMANEKAREREKVNEVLERIGGLDDLNSPQRTLIHEGSLVDLNKKIDVDVVLFSDVMIYKHRKEKQSLMESLSGSLSLSTSGSYAPRNKWQRLQFDASTILKEVEKNKSLSFQLITPEKQFRFGCSSERELTIWVWKITQVLEMNRRKVRNLTRTKSKYTLRASEDDQNRS